MPEDPRFLPPTPFSRLVVTHAASVCADACVAASLAGSLFFAQPADSARSDILLYLLLTMAPFAIVAPVMGPALDRIRGGRRLMVVFTTIGRAVLCLAMAQFIIQPSPEGLLIYPLAFGILVFQKTYSVAKSALLPALVEDEEEFVKANSRLALISLLASIAGGAPAFGLQQLFDARWSLGLATVLFVTAAVLAMKIPRTQIVQGEKERELEQEETHQPSVLLAGSAMAVSRASVGFIVFFSAFAFKDDKFGLVLFAIFYGLGSFSGNIAAPFLRERVREETILAAALTTTAVLVLLGALMGGTIGGVVAGLGVAAGAAGGRLGFDSLLQRDGPDAVRGRAFARFEMRFQMANVMGALCGLIPVAEQFGLLVLAGVMIFAGLSYVAALRATRGAPRTTIRPQAFDRAFDRAKGELRGRRERSRAGRRKTATERRSARRRGDEDVPPPPEVLPPRRPSRPAKTRGDPTEPFPGS